MELKLIYKKKSAPHLWKALAIHKSLLTNYCADITGLNLRTEQVLCTTEGSPVDDRLPQFLRGTYDSVRTTDVRVSIKQLALPTAGENQLAKRDPAIFQNQLQKNAQSPSRPVHALLGGNLAYKLHWIKIRDSLIFYHAFALLPSRCSTNPLPFQAKVIVLSLYPEFLGQALNWQQKPLSHQTTLHVTQPIGQLLL